MDAVGSEVHVDSPVTGYDTVSSTPGAALLGARGMTTLKDLLTRVSSSLSRSRHSRRMGESDRSKSSVSTVERGMWGLHFVNAINTGDEARERGWAAVEDRFEEYQVDGWLPRFRFGACIGLGTSEKREKEYALELFDALARRHGVVSWMINKAQLRAFWEQLTHQSFDIRLRIFFDMVDANADGRLTKDEVEQIITLSASSSQFINERAGEYAAFIMEECDPSNLGYVELKDLEAVLLQCPEEPSYSVTGKQRPSQPEPNPLKRWVRKSIYFIGAKWKRVWVILLWVCVCAALFAWKFIQYRHRYIFRVMGYCVCVAKGGAEITKFNMALILLPICRNTITWLRAHTRLGSVLPFNHNISFHKVVAAGIAVGVGLHAIAHLSCDFPRLLHASNDAYNPLTKYFGNEKPSNYWWFMEGTEGWTGLLMVALMFIAYALAMGRTLVKPYFRRKKIKPPKAVDALVQLKTFWYSHHLFVIVYALFIVHGQKLYLQHTWYKKTTWMYIALPMLLYAFERFIRSYRAHYRKKVDMLEDRSKALTKKLLALFMTKPKGFNYSSGQYIFIKCPDISALEWHPFSLTSAPGDEYLSVHIQKAGTWTTKMFTFFPSDGRGDHTPNPRKIKVEIDGPYSAPAQDYKNYEVVLLVGLGIGVTPFVSILKDVVFHNAHDIETGGVTTSATSSSTTISEPRGVKRAYLYWSAREAETFGCLAEELDRVAGHPAVEVHNHCTSVYEEGDARSALMAMLRSLHRARTGVDVISGSRVETRFGRPDWRHVFQMLASTHPGQRVGVFVCGDSPVMEKELKGLAEEFSVSTDTSAEFDFHKENF